MDHNASSGSRTRRRGAPPKAERISRQEIVAAATALVRAHGAQKFTVRALATKLGTSPMAVYHYFESKDAILMSVVDELTVDMPRMFAADEPCRDSVRAYAHYLRVLAREHPDLVRLLAPWTLTENAVRRIAASLSALQSHGFSAEQSVEIFNAIYSFAIGQAFLDAARADSTSDSFWPVVFADLRADDFAGLPPFVDPLDNASASAEFERALDRLLDGIGLT